MQKMFFRFITVLLVVCPLVVSGQIIAPTADLVHGVDYSTNANDSVIVFNVDNVVRYIKADTNLFPSYSVSKWEAFETPAGGFYNLGPKADSINLNDYPNVVGYRLTLNDGVNDTTAIAWIAINDFSIRILTKDSEDNITLDALGSRDCVSIGYIEVELTQDSLKYYNPTTNAIYNLDLEHNFEYEFEAIGDTNEKAPSGVGVMREVNSLFEGILRFNISNSWWIDAAYTMRIVDEANLSREDNINIQAIRPYADILNGVFEGTSYPEYIQLNDKEFYPDKDTLYYRAYDDVYHEDNMSAPGIYRFTSLSYNADSLIWNFGDSTSITTVDSIVPHTYCCYGFFYPRLEVVKYFDYRKECYSYFTLDEPIELTEPAFIQSGGSGDGSTTSGESKPMNVFSPPNGTNPIWRYDDVSITDIEIAIYNRYGRRVHYFKGNIRDWGGWEGTAGKSSDYVSTGVYFYVLKDFSYAPEFAGENTGSTVAPEFESTIHRGTIHLFNTE